jgi:hypothetical protein
MLVITKQFARDILDFISRKIQYAEIITDQATRYVSITSRAIIDDIEHQEMQLNIELFRSDEVSETLQEIRFYDIHDNLILKTINLSVELPAAKISFIYQIKLVYSQ